MAKKQRRRENAQACVKNIRSFSSALLDCKISDEFGGCVSLIVAAKSTRSKYARGRDTEEINSRFNQTFKFIVPICMHMGSDYDTCMCKCHMRKITQDIVRNNFMNLSVSLYLCGSISLHYWEAKILPLPFHGLCCPPCVFASLFCCSAKS
jgi:hypothetical protein